jgi:cephalosporin-C deacetylase
VPFGFDPTYGYSLQQLLAVKTPKEPKDFDNFWQTRYQKALTVAAQPHTRIVNENKLGWRLFEISYTSTDNFTIRGWLLLPSSGVIKRGFIIGHGYGGRNEPVFHLPFKDAALLFPSFGGLALSAQPHISSGPFYHVLHNIHQPDRYILGGCIEDVWLAVSALLHLFPDTAGHLGYLGISFSCSALKPADKQEALQETQNIATAAQQASEENTGVMRKALRYFKGLATELEGTTETALKIGGLFGI